MAEVEKARPGEQAEDANKPADLSDRGGKKLSVRTIGIVAGAVVLGIASGGLGLGPLLGGGGAEAVQTEEPTREEVGESHGGGDGHGGGHAAESSAEVIELENIVVNPAGTEGMRFVMVSFGLQVEDAAARQSLVARELEVRDVVSSMLERQTLEMLTSPYARDSLRSLVARAVAQFLPEGMELQVLVPRFVIQ
jgi:flagellar FliL protein